MHLKNGKGLSHTAWELGPDWDRQHVYYWKKIFKSKGLL